jgi:uncharacterized membrane protein YdbT with pleckstrin-like domain
MVPDQTVLRRRTSLRSFAGLYVGLAVIAVVVWVGGFASGLQVPPALIVLAGLVPLLVGIAYAWIVARTTEYRLFEESLEVESGVLSRRIENLQLFRVRDLGLHQSLLARLLGIGDVTLSSTDRSSPRLILRGITEPRQLYERLRGLVARSQATRRTMIVEDEEGKGL